MFRAMKNELEVLVEQLDELLGAPITDTEDALEVATVAGLAARLGASPEVLAAAVAWRDDAGRELIDVLWQEVDTEDLLDGLEDVSSGGATNDEQVEEAVYDFDDLIAAAVWCGKIATVKAAARRASDIIRLVPDPFASLADVGSELARLPSIAEHVDLYDYWLAIADSRSTLEE